MLLWRNSRLKSHFGRETLLLCGVMALALLTAFAWSAIASADDDLCASCHGDKARLKSLSPRWRDLFVDPVQYAQDKHGRLACITCHGGDKHEDSPHACKGVALKNPADPDKVQETCGSCHPDITARYLKSLHNTLEGHKLSLVDLMGEKNGLAQFEKCDSCHATCSSCHMEQPDLHNRLMSVTESHSFTRWPSSDVCHTCHGQTGDTYLGEPGDQQHNPAIMATAGLECIDCHVEKEIHGTGTSFGFMAESPKPNCAECHSQPKQWIHIGQGMVSPQYDPQNPAHQQHQETLSCVACHTQWYDNCWDCHKGSAQTFANKFFLAQNPLTGEVQTAAHSPVTWEYGGVPAELGGWAIKGRHSWGKSQTCEKCHTDPDVYIDEELRQAQFVGFWSPWRANASFVDEKLVEEIVIDEEKLKQDAHKDTTCMDCHKSLGDDVCADCHAKEKKTGTTYLSADADWSRSPYMNASSILQETQKLLEQPEKADLNVSVWQKRWAEFRGQYLDTANEFHGNPGPAQQQMEDISQRAVQFKSELDNVLKQADRERLQRTIGLPLALGVVIALSVGVVFVRSEASHKGKKTRRR